MTSVTVECERDDCPQTFTVDDGQDSARCPSCGTKHTPPWNEPATSESTATAIEAPADATIRITIDVIRGDGR